MSINVFLAAVSSGTPTGLHFIIDDILETTVETEVGRIECLESDSPTLFTLQNAEDVPFEINPAGTLTLRRLSEQQSWTTRQVPTSTSCR